MSHRLWRFVAGTLLSIGLLWLAARGVSWVGVSVALGSARWSLIAVAAGCVLVATVLRAWCWRRLLVGTTVPVTLVGAWKILLIGQFLNICVPARAGEGMSRALLKLSGSLVHDYATISDDSPSPNRASRARRAATSAGIS